jgi:hypothetical protein
MSAHPDTPPDTLERRLFELMPDPLVVVSG